MSQTSYSRFFSGPFAGQILDSGVHYKRSRTALSGSDLPAGVGVIAKSGNETACESPASATTPLVGIVINDFARDPDSLSGVAAVKDTTQAPLMVEGPIMVPVEQDVTEADQVFVRYTANGAGKLQLGAFRKDLDGVAEVHTITPTAVNSTVYVMTVEFTNANGKLVTKTFLYTSDGSATATEISSGFQTAMALDAEFTAAIVASGTTTLVLTGQTAGLAFTVTQSGLGAWTEVVTTPAAAHARRSKGSRFLGASLTTASGVKVAPVYFSAAQEAASF